MKKIHKILFVVLATLMFTGLFWKSIKPIWKDIFPSKHSGYEKVRYIKATDPEGDSIIFRLVSVFPEHDFKLEVDPTNPNAAILLMNRENIKSDQYKVRYFVGGKTDSGKIVGKVYWYIIKDVEYKD